ncbi:MAG: hypothetical protein AB1898_12735 [Acidobacteriota bacterium]
MVSLKVSKSLIYLLQFHDFQDTVRYYLYKYAESKVMVFVYALVCLALLTLVYRFLARK